MSSKHSSNSATEKVDETNRDNGNQEPDKTENVTTVNGDDDIKSQTDLKSEVELPVPEVDADILEIIDSIKNTKNKIKKFIKDDRLLIEDLVIFKDKLDDITGIEMDSLVKYVATSHIKKKDKYCLQWEEIWKILVFDWPIWENENRNMQKVDEWIDQEDLYNERLFNEEDEGNFEKEQLKGKGKYILKLKLDQHLEKIGDIFRSYCENIPKSDSDSDAEILPNKVKSQKPEENTKTSFNKEEKSEKDGEEIKDDQTERKDTENSETMTEKTLIKSEKTQENPSELQNNNESIITLHKNVDDDLLIQVPTVKISKIGKIMKDLGYLIDLSFMTHAEYVAETYEKKKTNKEIVKRIQKY